MIESVLIPHKSYPIEQNQGEWQMLVLTRRQGESFTNL